jgi:hypothetical protein
MTTLASVLAAIGALALSAMAIGGILMFFGWALNHDDDHDPTAWPKDE